MRIISKIVLNRNFILVLAMVLGLTIGKYSIYFKDYMVYILAFIMIFSTTGIAFREITDVKYLTKTTLLSILLNYIIFGAVMLLLAYFLFDDKDIFNGFVVIIATPPGVAILPFTFILKGDSRFSLIGILGTYVLAIFITPLILMLLTDSASIKVMGIIIFTGKVVVLPLILSRFLLIKPLKKHVEKYRGQVVNWGFALIIFTAIGLNRNVLFSDISILVKSSIIMILVTFGIGSLLKLILKNKVNSKLIISTQLMLTIKSSGFAIATSLAIFGERAAIPSAFLSIYVLIYLLFLSFTNK